MVRYPALLRDMAGPYSKQSPIRVAIDTGGTFTDCVWVQRGRLRMVKVFSTPKDPSQAIVEALRKAGLTGPVTLLHGTTVGTNTLLQRKGARVALVTTAGFEDAIEIGRQARPKLYDLFFDRVEPLVPPDLRFGVRERTSCDGTIEEPVAVTDLQIVLSKLQKKKPEAVAVSLLFSFADPANERAVAAALKKLNVPLSISHLILPEFREYERTSTVAINAYLQPVMQAYLENLERRTQESRVRQGTRIFVMQSSGGITALRSAAREPVRTVLSGPAGGVVGALAMARRSEFDRIISFDMGGTSTDVALVDRHIRSASQTEIAGLPIGVPMLDIQTVGAGGGSIARFDAAGALRVGPESAGADPGPICYGRGTEPTVTDANLILGRLRADEFLGGDFVLDAERGRKLLTGYLKKNRSRLSLEQFASGVVRVVNATMEKAIRLVSIERGYDPREFTLVAFGGAGALHACELAEALSIPRVLVPALPGALSALGILSSDVVKDYSRTVLWQVTGQLPTRALKQEFDALQSAARSDFRREGWPGPIRFALSVDARYRGQGYELNLPYTAAVLRAFEREHQRQYGHRYPGRAVELVTLRLRASIRFQEMKLSRHTPRPQKAAWETRFASVIFRGKAVKTAIFNRAILQPGRRYSGPAVITEYSATVLVPPRMRFSADRADNLIIATK
jgi:N-methylhydantoinase A